MGGWGGTGVEGCAEGRGGGGGGGGVVNIIPAYIAVAFSSIYALLESRL